MQTPRRTYDPDDSFVHPRLKGAGTGNTPEAQVRKFKRNHKMIFCIPRGCQMSLAGCRKLKKKSAQVKQFVQACRISTITPAYHDALKCIECRRIP